MSASTIPRWAGPRTSSANGTAAPSGLSRAVKAIVLTGACLAVMLPFLSVISTSLAGADQVNSAGGFVLWPHNPNFDSYRAILSGGVVTRALLVSLGITFFGTLFSLACTTLLAYSLSRPGSFGHKPMLLMVLFTLLFTPGIIPNYLMIKSLGLIDSYWSLILPVLINGFNVIVVRAFFLDMPQELLEAARIDGASDVRILFRVVLPLSKAPLAVVGLFYAVGYWNSFFNALLYLNDSAKWPLQLVLRTYVVNNAALGSDQLSVGATAPPPQESLQMAILVVAVIPILLVYPFIQRHFTKGVLIGAVKG